MKWFNKIKNTLQTKWMQFDANKKLKPVENEVEFYSLNWFQLKNLLDKNIAFGFFKVEDFFISNDKEYAQILKKLKRKTEEELLLELKDQNLEYPVVLICQNGGVSKSLSKKLKTQGFINVYFVKGGWTGLLESKG